MKSTYFSLNRSTLVMVFMGLLSASTLQAQTFNGQEKLTESPAPLEAAVYPLTHAPTTINVIFKNQTGDRVWVMIKNETGEILYSAFESATLYRRNFDLSELPSGSYTVELSKRHERYTRVFTIAPPSRRSITMDELPARKTPRRPVDAKLMVSQ